MIEQIKSWLPFLATLGLFPKIILTVLVVSLCALLLVAIWAPSHITDIKKSEGNGEKTKIANKDVILFAQWDSGIIRERRTVANGEVLKGKLNPSRKLELAFRNQSNTSIQNLVVKIHGNARTQGEPSEYFQGQEGLPRQYLFDRVWKSKSGTSLSSLPSGFDTKEQAIEFTTLQLGTFHWDRTEGVYFLQITLSGEGLAEPVQFEVALEPNLGYR
jgi:hypothetical protein